MLFRAMDADGSKTLETTECQTYLRDLGYLDEEIDTFFATCDENGDGVIEWSEFLRGASTLYKPKTAKGDAASIKRTLLVLPITVDGSESATQLAIDSDMSWKDVVAEAVRVMEDTSGFQRTDSSSSRFSGSTLMSTRASVITTTSFTSHVSTSSSMLSADFSSTEPIFFEYTNVKVARELKRAAADIFDQIDVDASKSLERNELLGRMRLPPPEGWGFAEFQVDDFIRYADADNSGSVDRYWYQH